MLKRSLRTEPPPDPRIARPQTLGEARRQIETTFADNDWDEAARARYLKMAGLEPKPTVKLSAAEARLILEKMEGSRMILYKQENI